MLLTPVRISNFMSGCVRIKDSVTRGSQSMSRLEYEAMRIMPLVRLFINESRSFRLVSSSTSFSSSG